MPAKDRYHNAVRHALEADGWTITDDPLHVRVGKRDMYVDLGAERLLAAERGSDKIAVEVKTLGGASQMANLEQAIGQFVVYHDALALREPERVLYLAIPQDVSDIFEEPLGQMLLNNGRIRLLVFDAARKRVVQWLPEKS